MKFLILASIVASAAASPLVAERGLVCTPLFTPQCCQLDVDGVLDLTCEAPESTKSVKDFKASCASTGSTAKCCLLPVDGDGVVCNDP